MHNIYICNFSLGLVDDCWVVCLQNYFDLWFLSTHTCMSLWFVFVCPYFIYGVFQTFAFFWGQWCSNGMNMLVCFREMWKKLKLAVFGLYSPKCYIQCVVASGSVLSLVVSFLFFLCGFTGEPTKYYYVS